MLTQGRGRRLLHPTILLLWLVVVVVTAEQTNDNNNDQQQSIQFASTTTSSYKSSSSPSGRHVELSASTLKAALVITRHGDRTPVKLFPNSTSEWPEGLGQLTWLGMKQHYELGQKFRQRYVEEFGLLSPRYSVHEVFARSTSKERTLMSAQSFMHGLYPPGTGSEGLPGLIQPVPIHAAEKHQDRVLYAYKNCPRLKELAKKVKQGAEWESMNKKTERLRRYLSQLFGYDVQLGDVASIKTLLQAERIHNRPSHPVTPEMMKEIERVAAWFYTQKFPTRQMGCLAGGILINEIKDFLASHIRIKPDGTTELITGEEEGAALASKPKAEGKKKDKKEKSPPKFTLFSAHDGTLLGMMSALSLPNISQPRYSSYFAFELHSIKYDEYDEGEEHVIQVLYNDEQLILPICEGHICPFSHFEQLVSQCEHDKWEEECHLTEEPAAVTTIESKHKADKSLETLLEEEERKKNDEQGEISPDARFTVDPELLHAQHFDKETLIGEEQKNSNSKKKKIFNETIGRLQQQQERMDRLDWELLILGMFLGIIVVPAYQRIRHKLQRRYLKNYKGE
ncbi:Acid phosphatase 3 [Balamuthia mandrillaris]